MLGGESQGGRDGRYAGEDPAAGEVHAAARRHHQRGERGQKRAQAIGTQGDREDRGSEVQLPGRDADRGDEGTGEE